MFRRDPTKLQDTPENKQQILEMVRNADNCYGQDLHGVVSYAKTEPNGNQLWAEVNPVTQKIRNCGINICPRIWDPRTGFKQPPIK